MNALVEDYKLELEDKITEQNIADVCQLLESDKKEKE